MEFAVSLIDVTAITNAPPFLSIKLHNVFCGIWHCSGQGGV